jgi:hypothetical protein
MTSYKIDLGIILSLAFLSVGAQRHQFPRDQFLSSTHDFAYDLVGWFNLRHQTYKRFTNCRIVTTTTASGRRTLISGLRLTRYQRESND